MQQKLTADAVNTIFNTCLCNGKDKEIKSMKGTGCGGEYKFYEDKLKTKLPEIKAMLLELPKEFMKSSKSGGMSFLNACITKKGAQ